MSHAHPLRSAELSTTQAHTLTDTHTHTQNTHDNHTGITTADGPRKYLLYNVYTNVEGKAYNVLTNANAAVRNIRYKLIHAFVNNSASLWYPYNNDTITLLSTAANTVVNTVSVAASSDDISETDVCPLYAAMEGSFALMLFDLQSDPYETTNLYNNLTYQTVQVSDVLQLSY